MEILSIFAAVLFGAFAVSYGWGVRGYIIGGEKGALLPGALLGFSISMFCADGNLKMFFPFFCAAGALSMFYGGTEPYAQTMGYILRRDVEGTYSYNHLGKGIVGIFLKGGLWFGISGTMLAILPGALSGIYSHIEIIIMFALIPLLSFLGKRIFNSPFDRDNKVYPKIYFSDGSREEWGGNVLLILELLVFAFVNKDYFAVGAAIMGIIFGGTGFTLGLFIYDFCVRKHNGKYFFGSLQEKGFIDGWKIMEHTLGATGGAGIMLWFCLNSQHVSQLCSNELYVSILASDNSILDTACSIAVILMLLITAIQYPITEYYKKNGKKEPDIYLFEITERPFFSAVPLIFVFLGFDKSALAVSFITLLYALCEKCIFEWFSENLNYKKISVVFAVVFTILSLGFYLTYSVSAITLIMLYTFGYTSCILYKSYNKEMRTKCKNSGKSVLEFYKGRLTVDMHFVLQCIVITAVSIAKIYS